MPALVARCLTNCSRKGDIIFDPFLGSGTTMVAAVQTGRACYGMELEPKYVAVTWNASRGWGSTLAAQRIQTSIPVALICSPVVIPFALTTR